MSKGFASSYRSGLLAVGMFACFAAVGTRLVSLHVINRDEYLRSLAKARGQNNPIPENARRGDILDRNGAVLATSRSLILVKVTPGVLRERDRSKWPQLAALLGMPLPEVEKILTTKFRPSAPVKPAPAVPPTPGLVFNFNFPTTASANVSAPGSSLLIKLAPPAESAAAADADSGLDPASGRSGLEEIKYAYLSKAAPVTESTYREIEKLDIFGVGGDRIYRRIYPHNELGAHVIGFVNRAQTPATGVERYADFYLHGQDGWREGERDGRARELPQFSTREVPRADGYSVKLSLDVNVQDIVEQELAYIAQKYQPLKATIIVSDPRTGFILGMGNYPTFDPNEYNKVPAEQQERMKNVAITDIYEPGSVFKIVAASGAIEERLATPNTTFDCSLAKVDYLGRTLNLPPDDHAFADPRSVPVSRIVSFSSNRGAAQLGMLLGADRLYRYARAFGFGRTLGFSTGGEVNGILHPPDQWYPIDITRIPMGHTISATALQMHQAMSAIANDGVLLRPQIIKEIKDASGETLSSFGPTEIGRAVSVETARTMARLLMGVASKDGTAPGAAIQHGIVDYQVAGKTGTTQKLEETTNARGEKVLEYSSHHHVASFVGFFPASRPQVAISVIVDDADAHAPNGVAYGAAVAAPSFKRIGERLITYLAIEAGPSTPPSGPVLLALEGGHR